MTGRPPRFAEWLIAMTAPPEDRAAMTGDLSEEFDAIRADAGAASAARWYIRQALVSLGPNLARRFRSPRPYLHQTQRSTRMSSFLQDLRFAGRLLLRRPGLATVAGLSMATGITLSAIVFSLLDAAVLRPLPVIDPEELAVILSRREGGVNHNLSYPDFSDYRAGQRAFVDMLASGGTTVTVRGQSGTTIVDAEMVSGSYFAMLGVRARQGRVLTEQDFDPSAPPVAVVSESLWREIAGMDTPFDGRAAIVNGQSFAIAGIVERGFRGIRIGRDVRLWTTINRQPIVSPSGAQSYWDRRTVSWLTLLARLKPGTTLEQGGADLNRVEAVLGPSVNRQEKRTLFLAPGHQGDSSLPSATADPLRLLMVAALAVLLVAAANVANLLAARASDRRRELAIRMALGAGRARLIRLLLAEAAWIGAGSSALALLATVWLSGGVLPLLPGLENPAALDVGINWRLAGFVALLGILTTVLSSLIPIVRISRSGAGRSLADAGRAVSVSGHRFRHGLVVAQFALSLALVVGATLLTRTVFNVRGIETGLEIDRVVLLEVEAEAAGYPPPRVREYLETALARLSSIPGVIAAGYGRVIPLGFGGSRATIEVAGYTPKPNEDMEINYNGVSHGYFETLGISLVQGRFFTEQDTVGTPRVAVINETMARRYWPNGVALGQTFRFAGSQVPPMEVVGIVRDVKYRTLREEAGPSFYTASRQAANARSGVLHVRMDRAPGPHIATLRRALQEVDPLVPVTTVRTLREQRDRNTADESLAMTIGGVLGGVALALAAVGLFAAMSSAVARRTREIGVRLSLGARPVTIVGLILGDSLRLVTIGAALGLTLAFWITRYVEQRLYGLDAHDPVSFIVAVLVLAAVALIAAWAPARRAAGVDPIKALRTE
jgi:macrolide transport system ATP-binding/permease protein